MANEENIKKENTEELHDTMAELAVMSAKMLVMNECENQGLDNKIEDPVSYNRVVSNFTNQYITNVVIYSERYFKTMNPSEAVMKANDKSLDIIKKNIEMMMED